ncbi:hypothetical protein DSO57_1012073 [Entomophthora muscae]|uniref:Uncharacterized protein n=1 Tax=Entomophthora muscae TaxID=34485 RepID=A0ACC2TTB1_9FUNG|nr:hypothetical protein DSO57_1012073 [Entomophthora muscae]
MYRKVIFNATVASFKRMVLGTTILASYFILHAAYYSYLAISYDASLVGKASKGQLEANGSLKFAPNTVWYNNSNVQIRQLPFINLTSTRCLYINGYECYEIAEIAYWLNGSLEIPSRSECDNHTCKVTTTVELGSDKGLPFELKEQELTPLPKMCPSTRTRAELGFKHPAYLVTTFWYTQIYVQLRLTEKIPQRSQQPSKLLIATFPLLDHACQPQFIYGFDAEEEKTPTWFRLDFFY